MGCPNLAELVKMNINSNYHNKNNISFNSGMTPVIKSAILNSRPDDISQSFYNRGITTQFSEDRTIAWCCAKVCEIIDELNNRYNIQIALPKGIIVEDFNKLDIENKSARGFVNLFPSKIYKNSDEVIPEQTIFFNSSENIDSWEYIDEATDYKFLTGKINTSHFLSSFLHEFSHVQHEQNLLNIFGMENLERKLAKLLSVEKIKEFQQKFKFSLGDRMCQKASEGPLEPVAYGLSKGFVDSITEDLQVKANPFDQYPFAPISFWQKIKPMKAIKPEDDLNEILYKLYNGRFYFS